MLWCNKNDVGWRLSSARNPRNREDPFHDPKEDNRVNVTLVLMRLMATWTLTSFYIDYRVAVGGLGAGRFAGKGLGFKIWWSYGSVSFAASSATHPKLWAAATKRQPRIATMASTKCGEVLCAFRWPATRVIISYYKMQIIWPSFQ